jgi:hypothetical protein
MNTEQSLGVFSLSFAILQWCLYRCKLKWSYAAILSKWLNLLYGLSSGFFCAYAVYTLATDSNWTRLAQFTPVSKLVCAEAPSSMIHLLQIYYFSKIWEATDIFLVALQGFPINLHFRVHHNTTPILAWALLKYPTVGGVVFMILNTFMHLLIYLYFGGCNGSFMFYMTRIFGHVQLIGGIIVTAWAVYVAREQLDMKVMVGSLLPLVLYVTYFALFQLEIYDENKAKFKATKKSK